MTVFTNRVLRLAPLMALAALTALCLWARPCRAQPAAPGDEGAPRSELLMHDIRFLEMLRSANFTAAQRRDAAKLIASFRDLQRADDKQRDADAFVQALTAVRAALVKGQAPTPELRQAVQAAQPANDPEGAKRLDEAREKTLGALINLLTDDQKTQLEMMPLVEFANQVVSASLDAQKLPDRDWQDWRVHAFGDMRDNIRRSAGGQADAALAILQHTLDRLHELPPEEVRLQRERVVQDLVTGLKDPLLGSPELADQALRDQFWPWVTDPRVPAVLQESAAAMGAA